MSTSLPALTASEQRVYSRMADTMNHFHNHFKRTYAQLYKACSHENHNKRKIKDGSDDLDITRPAKMSPVTFLNTASDFVHHLTMHHGIEEAHIFPLLAQRMPAFKQEMELLEQHKIIHEGLEKLEAYIKGCKSGKRELDVREVKGLLEGFGGTLQRHLDEEVRNLGAEEMRKYWSLEEMRRMPM